MNFLKPIFFFLLLILKTSISISNELSDQISELPSNYKLSNFFENDDIGIAYVDVQQGSSIYKVSDFYKDHYKKLKNKDIDSISDNQILSMIIELNSIGKTPAIVVNNGNPVLASDKKVVLVPPSSLLDKEPIYNIKYKLNAGKLVISDEVKKGDVPDQLSKKLLYKYTSQADRFREFTEFNPEILKNKDVKKMQVGETVWFTAPPLEKYSINVPGGKFSYANRRNIEWDTLLANYTTAEVPYGWAQLDGGLKTNGWGVSNGSNWGGTNGWVASNDWEKIYGWAQSYGGVKTNGWEELNGSNWGGKNGWVANNDRGQTYDWAQSYGGAKTNSWGGPNGWVASYDWENTTNDNGLSNELHNNPLEYKIYMPTKRKFVCLDFSILDSPGCKGDQCVTNEKIKTTLINKLNEGDISAFPLFESNVFEYADSDERSEQEWCSTNEKKQLSLGHCNDIFACSQNKLLLKHISNKNEQTNITFLLLHHSSNTLIDAISMDFKVVKSNKGFEIMGEKYKKLANIDFPKSIKAHSLVIIEKPEEWLRLALISRKGNKDLSFSTWKTKKNNVNNYLELNVSKFFSSITELNEHGTKIKNAVMGDNPAKEGLKLFNKETGCITKNMIEVVYPNIEHDEIKPITIEYFPDDKSAKENTRFLGDCFLVSHKVKIAHSKGKKIKDIHIFLTDETSDNVLNELRDEIKKLLSPDGRKWQESSYKTKDEDGMPYTVLTSQLKQDETPLPVYWHKHLPDDLKEYPNSLVIINAHHHGGIFKFNEKVKDTLGSEFFNTSAPNYILNACGNAEIKTFDKIGANTKYRNLIFSNKLISARTAAINLFCSVDAYLGIKKLSENCIPMSDWMVKAKDCMRAKLGFERQHALAFHFIGQMEDELCIDN